jgi:hypothetical protein
MSEAEQHLIYLFTQNKDSMSSIKCTHVVPVASCRRLLRSAAVGNVSITMIDQ